MKKPESTLSYDRCVPVFCCFVAAFYFADALILLTSLFCRRPLYRRYLYYIHAYQIHFHHFIFGLNTRDAR